MPAGEPEAALEVGRDVMDVVVREAVLRGVRREPVTIETGGAVERCTHPDRAVGGDSDTRDSVVGEPVGARVRMP